MVIGPRRDEPDYYAVLGVPESASDEEIRHAYRRLAREHHPDARSGVLGAERFREVTDAYDVIGNSIKREEYNAGRQTRQAAGLGRGAVRIPVRRGRPEAGYRSRSPSRSRRPGSGEGTTRGLEAGELHVSLEDVVLGTTAMVQLVGQVACESCSGLGISGTGPIACEDCRGVGMVTSRSGPITIRRSCSRCDGAGDLAGPSCAACRGSGARRTSVAVRVEVPAGIEDGDAIHVPVPHELRPPGVPGDVKAKVKVAPHHVFSRRGRDLMLSVPVTLAEAALGAEVEVPVLDGGPPLAISVAPGTQGGTQLRVPGRGLANQTGRGDVLIWIDVVIPDRLSEAERRALEAFGAATRSPREQLDLGGATSPARRAE